MLTGESPGSRRGSDSLPGHGVTLYVTDESTEQDRRPRPSNPAKRNPWWTVLSLGSVSGEYDFCSRLSCVVPADAARSIA